MTPEAPLEQTEHGLVPQGEGWFVLNLREARWYVSDDRPAFADVEGDTEFGQLGFHVSVLQPGQPLSMYHWEADQEGFLVLSGEAVAVVEGEERPLRAWDYLHCPPDTRHVLVGAGERPCVLIAVGARDKSMAEDESWGGYPVDAAAARLGASVEAETHDPEVAYAHVTRRQPTRYRPDWLG